ncbi:hypothetical protein ES703_32315 [subsurface metagenome]
MNSVSLSTTYPGEWLISSTVVILVAISEIWFQYSPTSSPQESDTAHSVPLVAARAESSYHNT